MAGYVCTIAGGKGGVGKTTTAINLAAAMQEAGYDTVVVDADLGMANLGAVLGVTADGTIHEVLAGERSVSEALTDIRGGITVLPGDRNLEAFAEADPAEFNTVVRTLRNAYDVVILDTGAGLSHEATVPLGLADGVVLVTTPEEVAVRDARKTGELADRVGGTVLGVVLSRATVDTDIDGVAGQFDSNLLAVVPEDAGAAASQPLVLVNPDSPAADAYRQLADRLADVFFEGADPEDVDPAFERHWFVDDTDDDGDDDDGRFGGLFG